MKHVLTTAIIAAAAPAFAGEAVDYASGDREFEGYLAKAESPKGSVVLIHDWDGLTDYERQRADMLAELGYNAFAIDLYGKGVRPDTPDGNRAETEKLYGDRELMRTLLSAGLEAAAANDISTPVVAGYCFGGAAALEMARMQPEGVTGYASFHGGLETPEGQDYSAAKAPIRVYQGGADQSPDLATFAAFLTELETAGTPYEAEVYAGAPHAFTVFGSDRYREDADQKSWANFLTFLGEVNPGP
ncbi:MAG TPA: dienelactone hydrolase family protein [Paracoccus sp. (in: a-proteobacteria)]|uniref:dienelactone hydrolase family protein n=1 Tax=uncultured Paracoccus sp. TaxID=189685 RepID=UPI0026026BE4|nr:alpha/beta fold hydrolase [uncultured Paracoccus sp.]HMQ42548.1 dienelactone hydrolase family protein [Paracoccus sp. (in: a-proteobacteria)]HMR37669.1 dienelactone hydrolase family protein [Paracoccus sp. (in: a-proteobacteria)]